MIACCDLHLLTHQIVTYQSKKTCITIHIIGVGFHPPSYGQYNINTIYMKHNVHHLSFSMNIQLHCILVLHICNEMQTLTYEAQGRNNQNNRSHCKGSCAIIRPMALVMMCLNIILVSLVLQAFVTSINYWPFTGYRSCSTKILL